MGVVFGQLVKHFENLTLMSRQAARLVLDRALAACLERGVFTLVLSGGRTPRSLYEMLASPPYLDYMPWSHTHLFWGDERMVPADHPDSNYAMSLESLVSRVPIPKTNVHRPDTGLGDPLATAKAYESELKKFFSGMPPRFDHILLGVGGDGHTASIFPDDMTAVDTCSWVCAVQPPPSAEPEIARVTFSLPLINQAGCVHFLVSGASKIGIIREIERHPDTIGDKYPAAKVNPEGELIWFIDDGV